MNRIEAEWIVAHALYQKKLVAFHQLVGDTQLNFGPGIMKTCKKCGRLYYADCIDCTFRNGGSISGREIECNDLIHQMHMNLHRDYLENALEWMRVPLNV